MKKYKKLLFVLLLLLFGCDKKKEVEVNKPKDEVKEEKKDDIVDISFSAVGDNLIHESMYYFNTTNDYSSFYKNISPYIKDKDIAYLNLETLCIGSAYGLSGYPMFNGPTEVLGAAYQAGFNWMSASSNHTMDRGEEGILAEINDLKQYKDLTVTGIHESAEEAKNYKVVEKQGVKVGLLSYTYGLNGFELPQGKEYLVDLIDEDKIREDMEALNNISDVQVVSMHWGDEYSFIPSEYQESYATLLSNLGADVIVGSHPHVIQPVTYIKGEQGNETLVIYSLGNFISHQYDADNMLGLMATWNISYNKTKQSFEIKDTVIYPTVTYVTREALGYTHTTVLLKDYTNEMASTHDLTYRGENATREYFIDLMKSVLNDEVLVDYE